MKDPVLTQALAALGGADIAASDDAGCTALLASITKSITKSITRVQGWLSSTDARVTSRTRELHATSGCMPASDRLLDLLADRTLTAARPDGTAVFTSEPDLPSRRADRSTRRRIAA